MKQIKRLRDAGYAIEDASEQKIRVIFLSFKIENDVAISFPKHKILNNNSWAVTRFLNHHGGVNCSKNREELKKYDLYKDDLCNEIYYNIKVSGESEALTEKFLTGEFILFGFVPKIGWVKVYYQSIGLLSEYKLVRKKVFPVVMICGNCAYFQNGACIHPNTRDNCGDSDSNRECYHGGFVSVVYNGELYNVAEKENFRLHKKLNK